MVPDCGPQGKAGKVSIGVSHIDFLGFVVDADGIHPARDKIYAICNALAPKNKAKLQAFLGLLNFYHAFLLHKAATAEPLHRRLDKWAQWVWGHHQAAAFQTVKDLLTSNAVLEHFNETLLMILACDDSPYGIGAVLGHQLPHGNEVPVAYFSQTLFSAQQNYFQIDKKGLTIMKGAKKFQDYICGRRITITTEHKLLLVLFMLDCQTL